MSFSVTIATFWVATAFLISLTICFVAGFLGAGDLPPKNCVVDGLATVGVHPLGSLTIVALGRITKPVLVPPVDPVAAFGLKVHTPLLTVAAGL